MLTFCHCNMFVSLSRVSGFPSFKNTYFKQQFSVVASKYRNLHYVQCLNIAPTENAWICEILFYQIAIVMLKDKNRCTIKDTMSMKISFMQYRNYITWTRVTLPVVFEEFDMFYIFWLLFTFQYHCQLVKGQL